MGRFRWRYSLALLVSLTLGVCGLLLAATVLLVVFPIPWVYATSTAVHVMEENLQFGFRLPVPTEVVDQWREGLACCAVVEGFAAEEAVVRTDDGGVGIQVASITPGLLAALGDKPIVGVVPDALGSGRASASVAVTEGLARSLFGGVSTAVGRSLVVDGRVLEVCGVLADDVGGLGGLAAGVQAVRSLDSQRDRRLQVVALLRPGTDRGQVQAELDLWTQRSRDQGLLADEHSRWIAVSTYDLLDSKTKRSLQLAFVAAIVLILVTASNVVHLTAARDASRQSESAIRVALGARPWQMLVWRAGQPLLLAIGAGLAALAVVSGCSTLVASWLAESQLVLPGVSTQRLPWTVQALAAVLLAMGFALLALAVGKGRRGSQGGVASSRVVTGGVTGSWHVLVLVSSALVACVASLLLLKTVWSISANDLGMNLEGLYAVEVGVPEWRYSDPPSRGALFDQAQDRLRALPIVSSVAVSSLTPPETGVVLAPVSAPASTTPTDSLNGFGRVSIGPQYFETVQQRLLAGREFTPMDLAVAAPVVIVSQRAARRFWGSAQAAVGEDLQFGEERRQVVGVVTDLDVPELLEPFGGLVSYWPMSRYPGAITLLVRTSRKAVAGPIRQALAGLDPDLRVVPVEVRKAFATMTSATRHLSVALSVLMALCLVLVLTGVFGVFSHYVARQRSAIGLRMAVGAGRGDIYRWIFGKGFRLTLVGLGAGLAASFPVSRMLAIHLFGVRPESLALRAVAAVLVLAVVLGAIALPARRASRLDPNDCLRLQ
jgi:predicted permease